MPEEYGGGSYRDGFCQINDSIVDEKDINPLTHESYFAQNWETTLQSNKGLTDKEWMQHYKVDSPVEYLQQKHRLKVVVGTDYIQAEETPELSNIRERCADIIREYSWKMIFAEDDDKFLQYWNDCKALLYSSGYEEEEKVDLDIVNKLKEHRKAVIEKYHD